MNGMKFTLFFCLLKEGVKGKKTRTLLPGWMVKKKERGICGKLFSVLFLPPVWNLRDEQWPQCEIPPPL